MLQSVRTAQKNGTKTVWFNLGFCALCNFFICSWSLPVTVGMSIAHLSLEMHQFRWAASWLQQRPRGGGGPRRRQQMTRAPVTSCPLPWSAYARLDQEDQRQLHGEALKWDEAQTWNCCHCDCFLHVVSQSVLVHGLAKWQRWVNFWDLLM